MDHTHFMYVLQFYLMSYRWEVGGSVATTLREGGYLEVKVDFIAAAVHSYRVTSRYQRGSIRNAKYLRWLHIAAGGGKRETKYPRARNTLRSGKKHRRRDLNTSPARQRLIEGERCDSAHGYDGRTGNYVSGIK